MTLLIDKHLKPSLQEVMEKGTFLVTGEIGPPKGTDIDEMIGHIDLLKDLVHGMNITDNQSSVMRYPSLATALIIKEKGGEPNLQVTCRDRNRMAIEADLLFAYTRGIRSVLCLTGDSIPVGDHPDSKGVFDIESVQLLQLISGMEEGKDTGGNELEGAVEFYKGAIVTPEADPIEPQMIKFEKKIEAGAQFFQTQAVYDMDNFKRFMERARKIDDKVKICAGLVLLTSPGAIKYMNNNVPGVFIPEDLAKEMTDAPKEERLKTGIRIMARQIRQCIDEKLCDGVHIMAIGKEGVVPQILDEAGVDITKL
ncbi:MAG: methylenetetrahydrofolate reductase [Actinomycetota bacterium]|nr:methylenetetrahydrofolate reductase [Actinomycetota bacterium]